MTGKPKKINHFSLVDKFVQQKILPKEYKNLAGTYCKINNIDGYFDIEKVCKSINTLINTYNKENGYSTRPCNPAIISFALNTFNGDLPKDMWNYSGWFKEWDDLSHRAFPREYVNLKTKERYPLDEPIQRWDKWCEICIKNTYS